MKAAIQAPAKLTLTLRILDSTNDGYHNLDALTVFLPGLTDVIEVIDRSAQDPFLTISHTDGSVSDLPRDNSNLVVRAWEKYCEHVNVDEYGLTNIGFHLVKLIPHAGGLGGGSADAAATLRLLNQLCDDALLITDLLSLAIELGSDVAACIYSHAVRMQGRGDRVDPLGEPDFHMSACLVTPQVHCPTPDVYRRYDEIGRPVDEGVPAPDTMKAHTQTLHNDLALAAYDLFPELVAFKKQLEDRTGASFMLAGSGSTFFTLGDQETTNSIHRLLMSEFTDEEGMSNLRLCAVSSLQ